VVSDGPQAQDTATTESSVEQETEATGDGDSQDKVSDNTEADTAEEEANYIMAVFSTEEEEEWEGTGAVAYGNLYGISLMAASPSAVIEGYSDYTPYLQSHEITVNGSTLKSGDTITPGKSFALKMSFELNLSNMARNGLQYYYPLPDHISVGDQGTEEEPITLYDSQKVAIGTYYIKDDIMYVTFPGYYDRVVAYFEMEGSWSDCANTSGIDVDWGG
jgi:hypothetical protein